MRIALRGLLLAMKKLSTNRYVAGAGWLVFLAEAISGWFDGGGGEAEGIIDKVMQYLQEGINDGTVWYQLDKNGKAPQFIVFDLMRERIYFTHDVYSRGAVYKIVKKVRKGVYDRMQTRSVNALIDKNR